ncbi:condensin complex subunit 3-like, partial [Aphidius gifuensis]
MAKMKGSIYEIMSELFKDVQKSKASHKEYFESLKNLYKESNFDEFFDSFLLCIKITLAHEEMSEEVQNALEFSAEFAARLSPPAPIHEAKMCPLLEKIFNFIFDNHGAIDTGVRSRICSFLSLLMRIMSECSEEVWINNNIWENILITMTQRLIDKSPEVRIEAVRALYNLQNASDNNCPVISKYITHLSSDLNPNVRKEIINNIARTNKAIDAVIERTIDNDETVRECAYLYLCKIAEIEKKPLSKKNQKILIKRGYNDTPIVRNVVCKKLILSWLNAYNNDIFDYLESFDCTDDIDNTIDIVLTSLLNEQPINTILKQLPIDLETTTIPVEDIKCEYIIYWRYLIKHLNNLDYHDLLNLILPDLREFCEYI